MSAHLLSYRLYMNDESSILNVQNNATNLHSEWPCNGHLLDLAVSAAKKLLPGLYLKQIASFHPIFLLKIFTKKHLIHQQDYHMALSILNMECRRKRPQKHGLSNIK